jgi:type II restriction/modification system DNA methylase subunit YeeA
LMAEWQAAKVQIKDVLAKAAQVKSAAAQKQHQKTAENLYYGYLERLRNFRVLDAAAGSGNFLYLALHALKDLEHVAQLDAEALGMKKQLTIECGTENILGIEVNEYAAELARITVWIGDIQWCQRNGRPINTQPILSNLDGIQHRDALMNEDGTETEWPDADVIVGNPPFLGGSKKRGELGDAYFNALALAFPKQNVPPGADLVCYWFDKARRQIEQGKTKAAGLVSTNAIRGGANRTVLDNICKAMPIFGAWPDEGWFDAGTAVRVSLVCFGNPHGVGCAERSEAHRSREVDFSTDAPRYSAHPTSCQLEGKAVALIHADLTAGDNESSMDLTKAKSIQDNDGVSFQGSQKIGAFDIPGALARKWLSLPNPNGRPNSDVLKPSWNGLDVTRRPRDGWIIDFGTTMDEASSALYEASFEYVVNNVKPERILNPRPIRAKYWWRHGDPQPAMRKALTNISRYIATPEVAKHRIFVWMDGHVLPDKKLIVVARADDTTFGILQSRLHELWALAVCTWHGVGNDPRYTPTTCFETFPFPQGMTPADTAPKPGANSLMTERTGTDFTTPTPAILVDAERQHLAQVIAEAAFKLNQLRENWLNPSEWVDWVITPEEEKAGFPKRPVAKPGHEADLNKRTLTNLYNAKPAWLVNAHQALDKAVAKAYGWDDYTPEMPDAEILQRLLKLNLAR